ncbi:MAG: GNAT family N-acetyltransferase, partial [Acinetobacter guillouiae]
MKIYPATPIHLKQLNQNFSLENLSESLRDPDQIWLLLENEQAQIIGYAKLNLNQYEPHLDITGAELQKIYLLKEAVGKNFASALMQNTIDIAREHQQASVFLEVLT